MIQFLFLVFLIFLLPSCGTQLPITFKISKSSTSKIRVNKKHYNPDETISIYYPEVKGLEDEKIQEQVNIGLKKRCNVDENTAQDIQIGSEDSDDDFEIVMHKAGDYDINVFNTIIMIKVYSYFWEDGAAGGYSFVSTLCIDCKTGECYKLEDLLHSKESLLTLQALLQCKLTHEQENHTFIVDEIPALKPDQSFYVTREGIEVIFEPYEITRGFNVFPSFLVTWQEMDQIINKEGDLYKYIQLI